MPTPVSPSEVATRLGMPENDLDLLLARVNAAAMAADDDGWIDLVAPDCGDAVRSALAQLRAAQPRRHRTWSAERLDCVRAGLGEDDLAGLIVPQADPHLGEYIPARHQRLAWLTGFTGSAGLAVLHRDAAALFVDGRYILQAGREVDAAVVEARHFQKPAPKDWLAERIAAGERIGYDPLLFSIRQADDWRAAIEAKGGELVALPSNPIDRCWSEQPPEPLSPVVPHPIEYAGETIADKCTRLGEKLAADQLDATVLNQLDAIAWLFNIRGNDVANTPLAVAYGILKADGSAGLYVDPLKLTPGIADHFGNRVAIHPIESLDTGLKALGEAGARVGLARDGATDWLRTTLTDAGAKVRLVSEITELERAAKNETERAGARAAHRRDSVAMARVLRWLDEHAAAGGLSERDVVARIETERRRIALHRGPSFDTIAGAGGHGAIVHYRVTEQSDAPIEPGTLLLVDSGGQYLDGTTDITRTVAVGEPPEDARTMFTLVLKGHIALARAHFPVDTTGAQIDALARQFLWQHGANFDHGTGHGVGSYLGVHEGPQRISPAGHAKLKPGMILSNEPGYYRPDAFGIRIENLMIVEPSDRAEDFLQFETITFAPIDRTLIDPDMLSAGERDWVDAYHRRVLEVAGDQLEGEDRRWLKAATAPV